MAYLESSMLGSGLALLQIVGLTSAWLARASEGSAQQSWCHWLFVGCLFAIGAATMLFVAAGTKHWLPSGATLSVMVLAAVWDFRAHASPVTHG